MVTNNAELRCDVLPGVRLRATQKTDAPNRALLVSLRTATVVAPERSTKRPTGTRRRTAPDRCRYSPRAPRRSSEFARRPTSIPARGLQRNSRRIIGCWGGVLCACDSRSIIDAAPLAPSEVSTMSAPAPLPSSNAPAPVAPLVVTPREACRLLSVCLSRLYVMLRSGELDNFYCGRARRIPLRAIEEYIARQLAADAPPRRRGRQSRARV
jgi:excisionase family DNA binding protein